MSDVPRLSGRFELPDGFVKNLRYTPFSLQFPSIFSTIAINVAILAAFITTDLIDSVPTYVGFAIAGVYYGYMVILTGVLLFEIIPEYVRKRVRKRKSEYAIALIFMFLEITFAHGAMYAAISKNDDMAFRRTTTEEDITERTFDAFYYAWCIMTSTPLPPYAAVRYASKIVVALNGAFAYGSQILIISEFFKFVIGAK